MPTRADELLASADRLAHACGVAIDRELVHALAIRCGWGARPVSAPLLPSGVSHGVPWGLSLAIEPAALELRLFVEAQHDPPSPAGYLAAAAEVTAFARARGADDSRLDAMLAARPHRVWHAVALTPVPRWHAYLCVPDRAAATEALARAGVPALPPVRPADRITMVSLDLTTAPRVKAYVLLPDASLAELAALHDRAAAAHPGDAERFATAMLGDPARRIWWLAALASTGDGPATCALHFGVPRHVDEPTATARIGALLEALALPVAPWARACAALGGHHFVTLQRRAGAPRVTIYFVPEVAR